MYEKNIWRQNSNGLDDFGVNDLIIESSFKYIKLRIEIEDTGVGIKKENLKKLFMDFGKLDEHSKMNSQGTGLGLSICKKMIEKMGGTVNVDSVEGVGTTFTMHLMMRANMKPEEINNQSVVEIESEPFVNLNVVSSPKESPKN